MQQCVGLVGGRDRERCAEDIQGRRHKLLEPIERPGDRQDRILEAVERYMLEVGHREDMRGSSPDRRLAVEDPEDTQGIGPGRNLEPVERRVLGLAAGWRVEVAPQRESSTIEDGIHKLRFWVKGVHLLDY